MNQSKPGQLCDAWQAVVGDQFKLAYMQALKAFLASEKRAGKTIYPPGAQIFNALNHTPFDKVRVVIIGQDPYHGPGQAHGLCFSVRKGVEPPPSLKNIFQELNADIGMPLPHHGDLSSWAAQGVLLLNAVLTVEQGKAGSHQGKGWEQFTDHIIAKLNSEREHIVFLLWGSYAQKKGGVIDEQRHCVLKAPHPSPLSAYRGFLGCRHFSRANDYLLSKGLNPINWASLLEDA